MVEQRNSMSFAEDIEMEYGYVVDVAIYPHLQLHYPEDVEEQDTTDGGVDIDGGVGPEVGFTTDQQ